MLGFGGHQTAQKPSRRIRGTHRPDREEFSAPSAFWAVKNLDWRV